MSASRRQDIITALATALGNVSSFTGRVYGWKLDPTDLLATNKTPCVCYKDIGEKISASSISPSGGRQKHELEMEFLILCQGADADTTIRTLLQTFYGVFKSDRTLGNKLDFVSNISDEVQIEQDSKTEAAALVKLTFEYQTPSFDF